MNEFMREEPFQSNNLAHKHSITACKRGSHSNNPKILILYSVVGLLVDSPLGPPSSQGLGLA